MCGIIGIVSNNDASKYISRFRKALRNMKHRGPDHMCSTIKRKYAIGYVRLAIRGKSECNQPIKFDSGFCYANGENYDHQETNKDNDLIELVDSIVRKQGTLFNFDADFAMSIMDEKNNIFYLARDRFGVKPLFYSWLDEDTICFASEIISIIKIKGVVEHSNKGLLDYLLFGYPLNYRTCYKDIYSFPRKAIFEWNLNLNKRKFIDLTTQDVNLTQYPSFAESIDLSVKKRLISDYPIASHLSGGLDSTLINFIVNKLNYSINTFTSFRGKTDRDYIFANQFARRFGLKHENIQLRRKNNYKYLIKTLNSPIMSTGAFVQFHLAKYIKKAHFKVVLEGQGADELLFGYSRFAQIKNIRKPVEMLELFTNSSINFLDDVFEIHSMDIYHRYFEKYKVDLLGAQEYYFNNFLQELLKIEDHVNMHYSIENRVPYLSKSLENYIRHKRKISFGKNELKKYHKIQKTGIEVDAPKVNGNNPAIDELQIIKKDFLKKLNKNYIEFVNKGLITKSLNCLSTLSAKQAYFLWMIYSVLCWCESNGLKKIKFEQKELQEENEIFVMC